MQTWVSRQILLVKAGEKRRRQNKNLSLDVVAAPSLQCSRLG